MSIETSEIQIRHLLDNRAIQTIRSKPRKGLLTWRLTSEKDVIDFVCHRLNVNFGAESKKHNKNSASHIIFAHT